MLKPKLQYFGHLMGRTDLLEKTLMLGRTEAGREGDNRGWDGWMASLTRWTWVWASSRSWWWTGKPGVLQSMGSQSRKPLSNWTLTLKQVKENRNQVSGPHILKSELQTQVPASWALARKSNPSCLGEQRPLLVFTFPMIFKRSRNSEYLCKSTPC